MDSIVPGRGNCAPFRRLSRHLGCDVYGQREAAHAAHKERPATGPGLLHHPLEPAASEDRTDIRYRRGNVSHFCRGRSVWGSQAGRTSLWPSSICIATAETGKHRWSRCKTKTRRREMGDFFPKRHGGYAVFVQAFGAAGRQAHCQTLHAKR